MRYTRVCLAGWWLFAAVPGLAAEATDNFNRANGGLGYPMYLRIAHMHCAGQLQGYAT